MSKEELEFDLALHLKDKSLYTAGIIQQLLDTMRENERLKAQIHKMMEDAQKMFLGAMHSNKHPEYGRAPWATSDALKELKIDDQTKTPDNGTAVPNSNS